MIEQIVRVTEDKDGYSHAEIVGEIVRCSECKNAIGYTTAFGLYGGLTCNVIDRDVDDEFYCAYGERKETECGKDIS